MMQSVPDVRCPRCGGAFTCGAAGPSPCACAAVELGAALRLGLQTEYTGCLCLSCLHELAAGVQSDLKAS
ncbi:MAG: cysteine-rich CWC family protein [Methyloversatilis sp.]|nr:cysteine-rich CWC family protein [Methyloversatilis sp.]MBP6192805.1 cysteine-rich CWC family protein [Methyloversatilis sp.]